MSKLARQIFLRLTVAMPIYAAVDMEVDLKPLSGFLLLFGLLGACSAIENGGR